ncbi:MAG: hypothetical protein KKE73_03855 [Proteobacteria bacterium]|nr:hypothetical protein [Pseudomonadota bacterium]
MYFIRAMHNLLGGGWNMINVSSVLEVALGMVLATMIISGGVKLFGFLKSRRIRYIDDGYNPATGVGKNQRKAPLYMRLGLQPPEWMRKFFTRN